jgi:DNA invertase Pin-like site-specific DNA recombinase
MTNLFQPGSLVAIYLRDSGGDQQDLSIARQEAEIRAWCRQKELEITRIFADVHKPGGTTAGRDQFEEMINYFHQKPRPPESGLLLWDFSRFARDFDAASFYTADLRHLNFSIQSINDDIPEGFVGRVIESMLFYKDAQFRKDLSRNARSGLHNLFRQYGVIPGTPPRGFKREALQTSTHKDGSPRINHRWVPDPETWDICKLAWQMRAAGSDYNQIRAATHLYKSTACLSDFFINRIYLGELWFGDEMLKVEPMISQETWDSVQALRPDPRSGSITHHRRQRSPFLLTGLAFCRHCGSPLNGYSVQGKQGKVYRKYQYYLCVNRRYKKNCPALTIPKVEFEQAIVAKMAESFPQDEMRDLVQRHLPELASELLVQLDAKTRKLREISFQLDNLVNAIVKKGDSRILLEKLTELEAEKNQLIMEKTVLETQHLNQAESSTRLMESNLAAIAKNYQAADQALLLQLLRYLIIQIKVARKGNKIAGEVVFIDHPANEAEVSMLGAPTGSLTNRIEFVIPYYPHRP